MWSADELLFESEADTQSVLNIKLMSGLLIVEALEDVGHQRWRTRIAPDEETAVYAALFAFYVIREPHVAFHRNAIAQRRMKLHPFASLDRDGIEGAVA